MHMTYKPPAIELSELEHPIEFSKLEHRPCICGGEIYLFVLATNDQWICINCCGAAGSTYEEAVREKIKSDFMRLRAKADKFLEDSQISLNETPRS